jgi:hypothetical protein
VPGDGATKRVEQIRLLFAASSEMVATVQIVVVSSPGQGQESHWSQKLSQEFSQLALGRGVSVCWLAGLHPEMPVPSAQPGLQVIAFQAARTQSVSKVADSQADSALEHKLTQILREYPAAVVLHVGLGGQGTPNVLWISDRLGSRSYACVRGVELVCHRGGLIDRDEKPCTEWLDPDRCRWCCSGSWFSRPSSDDMRNRVDLYYAGLVTTRAILVPTSEDVQYLEGLGLASQKIEVGATAEQLLARVLSPD